MAKVSDYFDTLYQEAQQYHQQLGLDSNIVIQVGSATCEKTAGSDKVRDEFQKLIRASGRDDILLKQTGCTGRCAREPIVGVFIPGQFPIKYESVTVSKVETIFYEHILNNRPVAKMILDKETENVYSYVITIVHYVNKPDQMLESPRETVRARLAANNVDVNTVKIFDGGSLGIVPPGEEDWAHAMIIFPQKVIYHFSTVEDLDHIIQGHFIRGQLDEKFIGHADYITEEFVMHYGDVSFFNQQTRLTLRNSGLIDPESLADYVLHKGYQALAKVLQEKTAQEVIDEISRSGLRGRGGGGFPTGQKWQNAITYTKDPIRYVICNADEGDPGAFMDRSALEGDPFIIIEGMTIGAYAIGAHQGFIYVRAEYPLAIQRLEKAIATARSRGLLGTNILNSGYDFDIDIRLGAGAFVCGEETALIYSIEGKRGQPRMRPPYPTQSGLWGHPTVINNVETWANVPTIMLYGADWFASIGTQNSKGTKVFALAGKVNNTGLIEVPMGTTLRHIIYNIGGGIPGGRSLKAVQTGGPSGGCIPADLMDTIVDYQTLAQIGSIMGSGGMIVLDQDDCMVATAKFFLEFTQNESCGKCVPCREGTLRMLEILQRITEGKAVLADLDKLERLGVLIQKSSLCGLGQTAPNPILNAIKNFREEFETHIVDKHCPARKCAQLIQYGISGTQCTGCTLCARRCPVSCIIGAPRKAHEISQTACIKCGECYNVCKFDAVYIN